MDIDEAYRHLGLTPLDDYLETHGPGKGSTTWMLVEAILHSIQHGGYPNGDVVLCAHTIAKAKQLWELCQSIAEKLGLEVEPYARNKQGCKLSTGSSLYFSSYNTVDRSLNLPEARQFWDAKWEEMAIRRKAGPYARIRKLSYNAITQGFDARDERDEFILTMTPEGADRHMLESLVSVELVDPKNLLGWS